MLGVEASDNTVCTTSDLIEDELIKRFEVGYNEDFVEYVAIVLNTGIHTQWGKQ